MSKTRENWDFDKLADALTDDLLRTSDSELNTEQCLESSEDTVLEILRRAESSFSRDQLRQAREEYEAHKKKLFPKIVVSIQEAREIVTRALAQEIEGLDRVTLAARKASQLSDSDIMTMLSDIVELKNFNKSPK
jgi:hypothetical protein